MFLFCARPAKKEMPKPAAHSSHTQYERIYWVWGGNSFDFLAGG